MARTDPRVALRALTRDYLEHHGICPFEDGDELALALAEDGLPGAALDIAALVDRPLAVHRTSNEEVIRRIARWTTADAEEDEVAPAAAGASDDATTLATLVSQPPVVRYVSHLVHDAVRAHASDIHIEAERDGVTTRIRLDGVLTEVDPPPNDMALAVVSRLKLLADMDVAERRRPQDGRMRLRVDGASVDLRVSTVPTMFGESVVVRLLDRGGRPVVLEELGLAPTHLTTASRSARRPHGLFLVTGPTGSGKTTTLYAALQLRDLSREKVITVEDPVEYQLPGVAQVPVQRQAGVTFATALRSILRQDPDVVMVGEMRDHETAETAVQAAMTGHLVLSTLHTNDTLGALPRLTDLGLEPYLISATLELVMAQRLVRRVCDACRVDYEPAADAVATIAGRPTGHTVLTRGAGCEACRGTGFAGRVGIFEILTVTDDLRHVINRGAPRADVSRVAEASGFEPLRVDAWRKVQQGISTVEEVLRVIG